MKNPLHEIDKLYSKGKKLFLCDEDGNRIVGIKVTGVQDYTPYWDQSRPEGLTGEPIYVLSGRCVELPEEKPVEKNPCKDIDMLDSVRYARFGAREFERRVVCAPIAEGGKPIRYETKERQEYDKAYVDYKPFREFPYNGILVHKDGSVTAEKIEQIRKDFYASMVGAVRIAPGLMGSTTIPAPAPTNPSSDKTHFAPKFKIGDKVIGNDLADQRYCITKKGWSGIVDEITNDGYLFLTVDGHPKSYRWQVNQNAFDLLGTAQMEQSTDKSKPCATHQWREYLGFTEKYRYCEICDHKER